jgi:urease accessory protein
MASWQVEREATVAARSPAPGWRGDLRLHYSRSGPRTVALDRHEGPLRVLQRLYPEGDAVCHHVLVHPPGGIVGGDELFLRARLDTGTHALLTTPGATRFYRTAGPRALQRVDMQLAEGTRLEWLPLETIAYRGCDAENHLVFDLAPGAQMFGWDVLALGLPAADQAYAHGRFLQQLQLPGAWLERGLIDGTDRRLLDSPLGLAGHRVLATFWFATGDTIDHHLADGMVEAARTVMATQSAGNDAGVTRLHERVIVLRALAPRVEPAMHLLQAVWAAWRRLAWALPACPPRVWRT